MLSSFISVNPTTGKVLKTYRYAPISELQTVFKQSQQAFLKWKTLSLADRIVFLSKVGKQLRNHNADQFPQLRR